MKYNVSFGLVVSVFLFSIEALSHEREMENTLIRQNKKVVIMLSPMTGFFDGGVSWTQKIGYHLDKNNIIEYEDLDVPGLLLSYQTKLQSLNYRKFFMDSVYLTVGIGQREIEESNIFTILKDIIGDKTKWVYNDIGINVAAGLQYNWSNFTLGLDLIGYYLPVKMTRSEIFRKDTGDKVEDKETLNRLQRDHSDPSLRALVFSIGASL